MTERQKIEKRLNAKVSQIVRNRDTNCITCNMPLNDLTFTPGHFMKRANKGTCWDLRNVNGQCLMCNDEDNWMLYKEKMIEKYGIEITEELIRTARSNIKFSVNDLKELLVQLKT